MNGITDTLEKELTKNAHALGRPILKASLNVEEQTNDEIVTEVYTKVNNLIIEWATQGDVALSVEQLEDYIKNYTKESEPNETAEKYFNAMGYFKTMYEPYETLMIKISSIRNNVYFVREETEQNAWRMAYVIKELRMNELQKKYNEPIDNEQMLLDNLSSSDLQSIQQSYDFIVRGLTHVYAWQDFIKFLADCFDIEELTNAIEADAISKAPIRVLTTEAEHTKELVSEHKAIEHFKPLIIFSSLLDIETTNKKSYEKVADAYIDCTIDEIIESIPRIIDDFKKEILQQSKGAS